MNLKKKVKIVNQGSAVVTIPKAMFEMMGLNFGESIDMEFDLTTQKIIISNPNKTCSPPLPSNK